MTVPHAHTHAPADFGRAFRIGIALNLTFVLVEALAGWRVGSLALVADAGHNLSDVGGLLLAWAGTAAARLHANDTHTYGWRRASILASFANAVILLVVMGALGFEAVQRLQDPSPTNGGVVMMVAGVGVLVNAATAWLFMSGSRSDLNIRGAYLHMAADALVSLGVVIAGGLYLWRGWTWIDPVVTMLIVVVIVAGTLSLFRQSLHLLFDGVPEGVNVPAIRQWLLASPGVDTVHDLHVWALSTSEVALSVHVVRTAEPIAHLVLLQSLARGLHDDFDIEHATIQIEDPVVDAECATGVSPACSTVRRAGSIPPLHSSQPSEIQS